MNKESFMRQRAIRLGVAVVAVLGVSAALAPATYAAAPVECRKGSFCLFSGAHQTGEVLYQVDAKVRKTKFTFPDVDALELPSNPRSARNPIPDSFGCVVRLNDKAHFAGDEQEIGGGDSELSGVPVASMTADCG
jgi:hypothetical protein